MSCDELIKILETEKEDVRKEIEKDKWYLSEAAGHDVGWKNAETHFINNYLNNWAEGYRSCYCRFVCKNKCDEYKKGDDQ